MDKCPTTTIRMEVKELEEEAEKEESEVKDKPFGEELMTEQGCIKFPST